MARKPVVSHWWLLVFLGLIVFLACSTGSVHGRSPSDTDDSSDSPSVLRKIEPALLKALISAPEDAHRLIVHIQDQPILPEDDILSGMDLLARRETVVTTLQETAETSQEPIIQFLSAEQSSGHVENVRPFWILNGLSLTGQAETAYQLARREDVRSVRLDHVRHLWDWDVSRDEPVQETATQATGDVEWNIQKIRADQVWNALNIDGSNVVVGSMDSGVDWRHPALFSAYRGNVGKGIFDHQSSWFCATDEGYVEPADGYGHGTHTMGTIVGQSDDHAAIGVAPGAKWISAKIFDDDGLAYESWIHAGFEWMLDPGGIGDPALIPGVVNNSWGSDFGYDQTFRPDVEAWRAAGIAPVFSAGNNGPHSATVGSPGSFPESITTGATNGYDYIALFSSRGPSEWGMKPDLSAPGVDVVSSLPGNTYGAANGTSMAAPHVTGVGALLLEANPLMSIDQMKDYLASTALSRGSPIPNNEYGWGRIDAYLSVASAADPGYLEGTVTRDTDGSPIRGAAILAHAMLPAEGSGHTTSDVQGQFGMPLAPWTYEVTASAFGYHPTTILNVMLVTGTTSSLSIHLAPLPTGRLRGQVTDLETGEPISATLVISGTPVTAATSFPTGYYELDLPAGTYSVQAQSSGHRVDWAHDVPVETNQTIERDFRLEQAPTILLVDSGAWYGASRATYFQQALDDLDYLYDRRTIYEIYGSERSVPTSDDLAPYDVVIWSCPQDSPGYVGAWEALASYLDGGGRLFITGQDIGYWDSPSGSFSSPEYEQYLQARWMDDDSGSENLDGLEGELLQGLELPLNGGDGADNQDSPDEITYADEALVNRLARYDNGGFGAQQIQRCSPYDAVYFSFGFEGISQRTLRREVMQRVLDSFTTAPSPVSSRLTPAWQSGIQSAGQSITYTLNIHNTNPDGQADSYRIGLDGHPWPAMMSHDVITVAACDVATVTAQVDVPHDTPWNTIDVLTVTARSSLSPTVASVAVISTSTPAPILLVDDDRWYDMESFYQTALEQNGLPYDYWKVGWKTGEQQGSPPLATLHMYPIIVWLTGYDWASPLSSQDEQILGTALDVGSGLFLSSQDYLYVRDLTPFGRDYLGIESYSGEATTAEAIGVRGNPVSNLLPASSLVHSFPDRSDALTPGETVDAAFTGSHGQTVGLTHTGPGFRSSFFAFPFESISPGENRRLVMRQIAGWLSWLGGSTFLADNTLVTAGTTMTYTLTMSNDGWQPIEASASNALPDTLCLVPGSLTPPEASYDSHAHHITWDKSLAVGEQAEMTYRATVSTTISSPAPVTNVVELAYDEHRIGFDRAWILDVNAPDLSDSSLAVDRANVDPGEVLTYTITLRNDGVSAVTTAVLTNPIPIYTDYVPGTLRQYGGGTAGVTDGVLAWDGSLSVGEKISLTYQAEVTTTRRGVWIRNVAYLQDHYNPSYELSADTYLSERSTWLPLIVKGDR